MGKEREISYEELRDKVEKELRERHGNLATFLEDEEKLKEAGFKASEKTNLYQYLSIPTDRKNTVKSVPALSKLHKYLFGSEVRKETKVSRVTLLFISDDEIVSKE